MSGLSVDQLVLDRSDYAAQRVAQRQRILPVRTLRRVQVGPHLSVGFENEDTVRYQVQEMIYVEGITDATAVEEQIEVYRRLVPAPDALMATMFLEFADVAIVNTQLDALSGVQHMIKLRIGESTIVGEDVPPPDDAFTDQTFTVHFLRFRFDDAQRAALADLRVPVTLSVNHPNYQASADVAPEVRAALLVDFTPPDLDRR